jgi:hypothetical protein
MAWDSMTEKKEARLNGAGRASPLIGLPNVPWGSQSPAFGGVCEPLVLPRLEPDHSATGCGGPKRQKG